MHLRSGVPPGHRPCGIATLGPCQVRESGDGMALPAAVMGGGSKDEEEDEDKLAIHFAQ